MARQDSPVTNENPIGLAPLELPDPIPHQPCMVQILDAFAFSLLGALRTRRTMALRVLVLEH